MNEILAWKLELLRKSLLLQPDFDRINIIGSDKVRTKFDNMVFDKHADSHHQAFLEIIEMLYPGLSAFIKQQYPAFSETEHNIALLLFAGLSTKDAHVVLRKSENTINKACTEIRKGMELRERSDFCAVLREMYENRAKS